MFLFVISVNGIIKWTWLSHLQVINFTSGLFLTWLVTPQEYITLYQHCYSETSHGCLNRERLWFPNIFSLQWNSSQKVKLTTQRAQIITVQIKQTMRPLKRLWGVMGEVLTRPDPTNHKTTSSWLRPGWCQHSHRSKRRIHDLMCKLTNSWIQQDAHISHTVEMWSCSVLIGCCTFWQCVMWTGRW